MRILLTGGRVWNADHTFAEDCPVLLDGERILGVGKKYSHAIADRRIDASGLNVLPGLVDVHTHGRAGYDFTTATAEQMKLMRADYAAHGVTTVFATLASARPEEWKTAISNIQDAGYDGIHLEGRYLNPEKRGAHAKSLLTMPSASDLERFLERIELPCHITAAYELDPTGAFIRTALKNGATLGIGHTNATARETETAIAQGVTAFTHLFNAMPPLHHRAGGAVSVALCGGKTFAELIVDGLHVSPEMVRLAYRCLGKNRLVLITDSMEATGCPDGEYSIAGQPVTVTGGKAMTHDGALAGSTLNLWDGVKNLIRFTGMDLADAVACATVNPAKMVGIDHSAGKIEVGMKPDLLLTDADLTPVRVIFRGKILEVAKGTV